jgi:phosphatidylethanolamine-binding protein (PEBP) family uncharacterized protein
MANITQTSADLATAGLIPLLADEVTEDVTMSVHYGGHTVARGETLAAAATAAPPVIKLTEAASHPVGTAFTLLCVDPHAPSPQKPWLHALMTNTPSPDPARGEVVTIYAGPSPPAGTGKHAYAWLAYRQPRGPLRVRAPKSRASFQVKAWARDHGLGAPAAATVFLGERGRGMSVRGLLPWSRRRARARARPPPP